MSEYVEFYGDHVFLVQMIPNIAQISIFINFIKNRIFYIFFIYFLKDFESTVLKGKLVSGADTRPRPGPQGRTPCEPLKSLL